VSATPLHTHYALAAAAIERGRHVLIEKPLAASKKEAESLAELADKHGVRLMVDHTFVYTGAVRTIRGLVDSGQLGDLLYLDSVRVNLGLFQQDTNVIWDLAAHDLSIMDYLVDARPVAVSADGTALAGFDRENVAYVTVHFDTGFLAHFHVNWLAPVKIRQMLFGGRQRMLVYDDMDPSEKVRVYDKGVNLDVVDDQTRRQILVSYRTGDMHAPKLDRREALSLVTREFADAIAERRTPLTGAAAGIRVVSLLEAAERSLRSQGSRIRM
jgi:predicted dehydrogenase